MDRREMTAFIVILGFPLLSGCSTLVDEVASTSPVAARILKGTSTWYDRQLATYEDATGYQPPGVEASHATAPREANIGPARPVAQSAAPAPVLRVAVPSVQTTAPVEANAREKSVVAPTTADQEATDGASIRRAGGVTTSTNVAPRNATLAEGLVKAYTCYAHFQYREAIELSTCVFSEGQTSSPEKALALIIAAASAYVLGQDQKCRDFLMMAVEIDLDVAPNPNVFPSEVCRLYRAARANVE